MAPWSETRSRSHWRHRRRRKDDMEAWDAIRARRNVREYTSEPVSDDDLNRIAEAGWRAPSAKNRQAWDFVIVTDKAQLQELSTVWQGAGHIRSSRSLSSTVHVDLMARPVAARHPYERRVPAR